MTPMTIAPVGLAPACERPRRAHHAIAGNADRIGPEQQPVAIFDEGREEIDAMRGMVQQDQHRLGVRIQKTGVTPSRTSRSVPPPTPVMAARKTKPTMSSSLREAASAPVAAKTRTPTLPSRTWSRPIPSPPCVRRTVRRRNRRLFGLGGFRSTFGDADHGRPQHALADHIARLHDLDDRPGRVIVGRHLEDRLMQVGIELLADRIELLDAVASRANCAVRAPSSRRLRSASPAPSLDLRASSGTAWMARARLSAAVSISRAKAAIAYCRVSAIWRSVRRRRFSISAMVRRTRSLSSVRLRLERRDARVRFAGDVIPGRCSKRPRRASRSRTGDFVSLDIAKSRFRKR